MKNQLELIPIKNRLENEIFIQKVLMTKELATSLLSTMVNNRNVKETSLKRLVQEINGGTWVVNNGETIKINNQGRLVDGQHRLLAVIKTDKPTEMYLTFNCHEDSIATVDTGSARSLPNILKINNIKYYTMIGGVVQSESVIIKGFPMNELTSRTDLRSYKKTLEIVKQKLDYLYFVCKEADKLNKKFPLLSASFIAKYFNVFYKIDEDTCFDFFNKLSKGTDMDSSIYLFRSIMIKDATKSIKKMSPREKEALFIKCWNHYVDGNELKILRWQPSIQDFPKVKRIEFIKDVF